MPTVAENESIASGREGIVARMPTLKPTGARHTEVARWGAGRRWCSRPHPFRGMTSAVVRAKLGARRL